MKFECTNEGGKHCAHWGCEYCGFNAEEAERRKKLPLVLCPDGLRRKIIKREVYRR